MPTVKAVMLWPLSVVHFPLKLAVKFSEPTKPAAAFLRHQVLYIKGLNPLLSSQQLDATVL